jgi:hypothetical protein
MNQPTPFQIELEKLILRKVRELKQGGTVAMGIANLIQVTPTPSHTLPGAPQGTNCQYVYRGMFTAICVTNRHLASFTQCLKPANTPVRGNLLATLQEKGAL